MRRILRAYSKRLAEGDLEGLAGLVSLQAELDRAVRESIAQLRTEWRYSWADVARVLGVTRQAAQQRYGQGD